MTSQLIYGVFVINLLAGGLLLTFSTFTTPVTGMTGTIIISELRFLYMSILTLEF